MSTVITVENLGKKYTISHQQREEYSSLRDVITNGVRSLSKKVFSPFTPHSSPLSASEDFWALKDVSFEVKQGDRIGIIGRNGAGKSTLLKILSRITEPTTGSIRIKGRVASLLEVGTGFHPELTGRENIYLNGAILGMQREEIRRKFDEIVDFAEIERFLDTPVKRYSSGMYVRLAFAVAAHLEPEILIVDEVLAVGDTQFQKKCLGKMEEVGREGRTVLFVSHNMGAIRNICKHALLLNHGKIEHAGTTDNAIHCYLENSISDVNTNIDNSHFIGPLAKLITIEKIIINKYLNKNHNVAPSDTVNIKIHGICHNDIFNIRISFVLYKNGVRVCTLHDTANPEPLLKGQFTSEVTIKPYLLRPGVYYIAVGGDNGTAISACSEWFFGNEIGSLGIIDEWDECNDYCKGGIINIPCSGIRIANGSS